VNALVEYLVRGVVSQPDAVRLNVVDGEASVLLELSVAPEDVARVKGPDGDVLRAIRTVLSAASGRRRAVLELLEPSASSDEE
jgi:hypothetical protein